VPPSEFIPLAEETGLIVPIGEWVLRTACAEASTWPSHIKVAVNLSAMQFKNRRLVEVIMNSLATASLSPYRLELEITESVLLQDDDATLAMLHQMRGMGVRISMDDFGTGYSSLSYLRKFPFDKIKIDRSFISDVEDHTEAETIVQAIIAMSRSLGLDVTAEGVETQRQLAMLQALGCNFVQGYLLGRPRSAAQLDVHAGKLQWHVIDHTGRHVVPSPATRLA
jgi:EAL domain-containing protein (putative c-di-GMP-specific phosphodiesterase class I)